jgi:hypothetical protein
MLKRREAAGQGMTAVKATPDAAWLGAFGRPSQPTGDLDGD